MLNRFGLPVLVGAAVVLALSFSSRATPPPPGGPVIGSARISGLQDDGRYDRFIITYRDGTAERGNRAAVQQNVDAAISRSKLDRARNGRVPVKASYQRKLAIGADLVRTSRKLDSNEAETLIRQIGADPAVLNVAPDMMRHAVRDIAAPVSLQPAAFVPDDTYFPYYQWHLKAPDGTLTYFGDANRGGANVGGAWDLADGSGITIAVLDTGLTRHLDVDSSLGDAGY